jgi:hypothetical protein
VKSIEQVQKEVARMPRLFENVDSGPTPSPLEVRREMAVGKPGSRRVHP